MLVTRRMFLTLSSGACASRNLFASPTAANTYHLTSPTRQHNQAMRERIARVIQEYDEQGNHRTGTDVDNRSARWLANLVGQIGHHAALEPFRLIRIDPGSCYLQTGERHVGGLPMFDGTFTNGHALAGRLGNAGDATEFGLVVADPIAISAEAESIKDLRRSNKHRGLILVTRGGRPGLCPINARHFSEPFGPPVLQVSSEEEEWLTQAARQQQEMRLVVQVTRTPTEAYNVVARIIGSNASLPTLIVWTPRSGWWNNAAERGGGLACWLEALRAVRASRPARSTVFLATSGHELGHLGLEEFLARRPGLGKQAFAWVLFGANIGAAHGQQRITRLQASDDEIERMAEEAMARAGTNVDGKLPRGEVPGGEVRNIHERGGRYVSLGGTNAYFHNQGDRWPSTVDIPAVERYAKAFADLTVMLAKHNSRRGT